MHPLTLILSALIIPAGILAAETKPATPVLVELFTSEGCSSCPPADALLSRLQHEQPIPGTQIIVLGEHVDYWDGLGWRDRFSSQQSTVRQNGYGTKFGLDSVYTPQMVVDGSTQFVGNDQTAAWRAVAGASHSPKEALVLSNPTLTGHSISANVSWTNSSHGDLYAALVQPMAETEVRHGENSGRRLQHVAVVRSLMRIGSTSDLTHGPVGFKLVIPEDAAAGPMQVVVFAQGEHFGPVLGIAMSAVQTGIHAPEQNLLVGKAGLPHLQ